jgi:hypothetical protein
MPLITNGRSSSTTNSFCLQRLKFKSLTCWNLELWTWQVLGVAPGNCLVVEDSVIGLQVDHISTVHVMIGHFCYTNFSFAGPNSLVTLKVLCCSCLCNLLDITAGNLVREWASDYFKHHNLGSLLGHQGMGAWYQDAHCFRGLLVQ